MKKLLGIVVLGLLWCNVGLAEYIELNKCFTVERTRSGEVEKVATHFDDSYNYTYVTKEVVNEDTKKYLLKYYKADDKIKKWEDVLYTINTSAGTVNRTHIWSDEFIKFVDRLYIAQYESGEIIVKPSSFEKVTTEKFIIESFTGGFIVTEELKNFFKEDKINIDLKNSIIYLSSNWDNVDDFDFNAKIQCNHESYETETNSVSGTAFFINKKGYLLTNNHVVEGCKISKINYFNKEYNTELISTDKILDLALLKTKVIPKAYISFSKDEPKKRQPITIAGYPLGEGLSDDLKINDGRISALKGFENNSNEITVDIAINPGNSGGPIVNEKGQLVAIAVSGMSKDVTEGINFGIKASAAANFLKSNKISPSTGYMSFSTSGDKLVKLLEESTVYTFCE